MSTTENNHGYTLIEMIMVIIILGILAAIAVKPLTRTVELSRSEETRHEMEILAHALAGDPSKVSGGIREDFGYIGDVGALPPSWDALVVNPGYSTWHGPYVKDDFTSGGPDINFKRDAWGQAYSSPAAAFSSTGSGYTITRQVANSAADLLYNTVSLTLCDIADLPPGAVYKDSVKFLLTVPDGAGSLITKTRYPGSNGFVEFDSIAIGIHKLRVVIIPDNDTICRYINVNPGTHYHADMRHFASFE